MGSTRFSSFIVEVTATSYRNHSCVGCVQCGAALSFFRFNLLRHLFELMECGLKLITDFALQFNSLLSVLDKM